MLTKIFDNPCTGHPGDEGSNREPMVRRQRQAIHFVGCWHNNNTLGQLLAQQQQQQQQHWVSCWNNNNNTLGQLLSSGHAYIYQSVSKESRKFKQKSVIVFATVEVFA